MLVIEKTCLTTGQEENWIFISFYEAREEFYRLTELDGLIPVSSESVYKGTYEQEISPVESRKFTLELFAIDSYGERMQVNDWYECYFANWQDELPF